MKLDEGWNQIHFNLTDFTRRAYGSKLFRDIKVSYNKILYIIEYKYMQIVE